MNDEIKILLEFNESDFTTPYQFELFHYWDTLKQGRLMPARSDIKVEDLKKYLPTLMLLDFDKEKETFYIRLLGTACVKYYGELTGKVMNDYEQHSEAVKRLLWSVHHKKPYYGIKNLANINKNYISTSFIVLPLSEDGENVDKLLVSHHFY